MSYLLIVLLSDRLIVAFILSLAPYLLSPAAGEVMRGGGRADGSGCGRLIVIVLCEVKYQVLHPLIKWIYNRFP